MEFEPLAFLKATSTSRYGLSITLTTEAIHSFRSLEGGVGLYADVRITIDGEEKLMTFEGFKRALGFKSQEVR